MRIELSEVEQTPLEAVLFAGLRGWNDPFIGPHGYKPLRLMVFRDGEDVPVGGIHGYSLAAWLHIQLFYLPEDLRRGGLGSQLMQQAEDEARARGCVGIYLDTFSFQARPFYEKLGYTLYGTIPDTPPGHCRYFLMKRLES
jgi:GNAT superfamily N-acetyltransferase